MDFTEIKSIVYEKAIDKLDHSYINNLISQPTAENIALWIWTQIQGDIDGENHILWELEVWETPRNGVVLAREDMQ